MIVAAKRGWSLDHGVRIEHAAVAQLDFVAHDGEGPDSNVRCRFAPKAKRWRGDRSRSSRLLGRFRRRGGISVSRSTILHISVASAASSPFTVACPRACRIRFRARPPHSFPSSIGRRERPVCGSAHYRSRRNRSAFSRDPELPCSSKQAARLRHGFDDQDARHHRLSRKMPLKIAFIDGDVLDSHNALPSVPFLQWRPPAETDSGAGESSGSR